MDRKKLDWWLSLLGNLGVLGGLVFVGLEIRQNTSQLRVEASQTITASVNGLNAGVYGDAGLADLLKRGEQNLEALDAIERRRFDAFQFSRLNTAEYVLDLETEGISNLNFRFVDHVVSEFRTKPGLQEFILEYEEGYVGSKELLSRLIGP